MEDPLKTSLRFCKGVGEKRASFFAKKEIYTLFDLFNWFPYRYEDRRKTAKIIDINVDNPPPLPLTFKVSVYSKLLIPVKFRKKILRIEFTDGTGFLSATFFNEKQIAYFSKIFKKGTRLFLTAKPVYDRYSNGLKIDRFDFEIIPEDENIENIHTNRIVPVYSEIPGISVWFLRSLIHRELKNKIEYIQDPLPSEIKKDFLSLKDAYKILHFPDSFEEIEIARKRMAFDRFFFLSLYLQLKKRKIKAIKKKFRYYDSFLSNKLIDSLPFKLTSGQERVWREISEDLEGSEPMNRLLQGDVGSGKTIVSLLAMLKAAGSGYQACLMAPTEILAIQHHITMNNFLKNIQIQSQLLTGSTPQKEKEIIKKSLLNGECKIVVGTHALIQEEVFFKNLSLVVIDEQHKFGVEQRLKILSRGIGGSPDLLVMTATPIPRTLSLTLYGDLDISVIEGLPPGRKPVVTKWFTEKRADELYQFICEAVKKGEKAYFIYPAVDESEDLKNATAMYEKFLNGVFKDIGVGLIHGRLKPKEKEDTMLKFRTGEYKILVATTVVEVGVDVPDATILVVENAERFGLSQLHQLRGRIGRSDKQSYCILVTKDNISEEAKKRMEIIRKISDGFKLSEEDLKLRGPGEFLGTKQSGMPDLFPADLIKDYDLIQKAKKYSELLINGKLPVPEKEKEILWNAYKNEVKENFEYVRSG